MKKVMLSALVLGMFLVGSAYAQTSTTAPAAKPATTKEAGAKSDKSSTKGGHHKGKGKKGKKTDASSTGTTAPADKK